VLDDLTDGSEALQPGEAVVDFQGGNGEKNRPEHVVPISGVIRVHDTFDMALLEARATGRPVPVIDAASPAEGLRIAGIGYPSNDRKRNPLFMDTVFGGRFGVKRAALGEVLDGSDGPDLFHDCSTLGGNSGSPLFSLKTGHVVGIHKGGFFISATKPLTPRRSIRSSCRDGRAPPHAPFTGGRNPDADRESNESKSTP
jgi:hypothetical protein